MLTRKYNTQEEGYHVTPSGGYSIPKKKSAQFPVGALTTGHGLLLDQHGWYYRKDGLGPALTYEQSILRALHYYIIDIINAS